VAWLLHDPAASDLVGATVAALVIGEVAATVAGRAGEGRGRILRSAAESLLLVRRRDHPEMVETALPHGEDPGVPE